MFGLGVGEIVVILVVALIFIGPKKLPGLAKGIGKGVREFQGALTGITDQIKNPEQSSTLDQPVDELPKQASNESLVKPVPNNKNKKDESSTQS